MEAEVLKMEVNIGIRYRLVSWKECRVRLLDINKRALKETSKAFKLLVTYADTK